MHPFILKRKHSSESAPNGYVKVSILQLHWYRNWRNISRFYDQSSLKVSTQPWPILNGLPLATYVKGFRTMSFNDGSHLTLENSKSRQIYSILTWDYKVWSINWFCHGQDYDNATHAANGVLKPYIQHITITLQISFQLKTQHTTPMISHIAWLMNFLPTNSSPTIFLEAVTCTGVSMPCSHAKSMHQLPLHRQNSGGWDGTDPRVRIWPTCQLSKDAPANRASLLFFFQRRRQSQEPPFLPPLLFLSCIFCRNRWFVRDSTPPRVWFFLSIIIDQIDCGQNYGTGRYLDIAADEQELKLWTPHDLVRRDEYRLPYLSVGFEVTLFTCFNCTLNCL